MSLAQRQTIVADLRALPLGRTVTDFLDYLVVEAGLSENTVLAYGRDLREFLQFCQDSRIEKMEDVKPWLVRKYFGPRAVTEAEVPQKKIGAANPQSATCNPQFLSENSAKRALVAIRMFLRFAKLRRLIEDDGGEVLDTPKTWQRLPVVCNKQQVLRLLEAPSAEETFYLRDKALLELLYATGVRASELANLKTTDVNLDIGYLRCFGKGNKERVVPVGRIAIAATRDVSAGPASHAGPAAEPGVFAVVTNRPAPVAHRDLETGEEVRRACGHAAERDGPHAASLLRHPPAQRRGRSAECAGDAGPCRYRDHADLHPRGSRAAAADSQEVPSETLIDVATPSQIRKTLEIAGKTIDSRASKSL